MGACSRAKESKAALFVERIDVGAETCAASRMNQNHVVQMIEVAQIDLVNQGSQGLS